ncbi:MAG: trehalose-phosphatase, partial [Chloroflexota bacterium]
MTELLCDFGHAQRRVLFLDYDGTLTHFVEHPPMARPSEQLLALLQHVARDPQNEVVLISGRDKETMQDWFGALNVGLVAEHGVWVKEQDRTWEMTKSLSGGWKSQILPILEMYADRLPGSFVEQKEFSLVWHYRGADPDLSSARARELIDDLVHFTANMGIQVIQGSKIVEIRNAEVNKGLGALHWLSKVEADFILAAGDDWTDEDLFKAIPLTAYSIKVGMTQSQARYYLREPREVLLLLERLRDANGGITLNGLTTHAAQQPGERA